MNQLGTITRRTALASLAASGGMLIMGSSKAQEENQEVKSEVCTGRLKQSVCRWCFRDLTLEELAEAAVGLGLVAIDLLNLEEAAVVKKFGLTCSMVNGPGPIHEGWNAPHNHDHLVARSEELIPKIAEAGLKNMIVFSGNRQGLPDDQGILYCVRGLSRIMPLAESFGVNVCMELLNSKRNHPDYQCDNTPWGVELAKTLASKNFSLLYDIFHMQIMEGDIIDTIQEHIEYIGHFHTGGVPGRNEIDETQELNYNRISQAIADTGFDGYFAHEFIPTRDPISSLRQAVKICTV